MGMATCVVLKCVLSELYVRTYVRIMDMLTFAIVNSSTLTKSSLQTNQEGHYSVTHTLK